MGQHVETRKRHLWKVIAIFSSAFCLLCGWFTGPVTRESLDVLAYFLLGLPGAAVVTGAFVRFGQTKTARWIAAVGAIILAAGIITAKYRLIPDYAKSIQVSVLESAQRQAEEFGDLTQKRADELSRFTKKQAERITKTTSQWVDDADQYLCRKFSYSWYGKCTSEKGGSPNAN